jgi:four helix bundle protein
VGFSRLDDVDAYNLSVQFKRSVYALVKVHPLANRDFSFRDQLFKAAAGAPANIAEGFARRKAKVFAQFLVYARGSVTEALTWIADGVDRDYYSSEDANEAVVLGKRALGAVAALQRSLKPFIEECD